MGVEPEEEHIPGLNAKNTGGWGEVHFPGTVPMRNMPWNFQQPWQPKTTPIQTHRRKITSPNLRVLPQPLPMPNMSPPISKCNKPSCLTCPHLIVTPYVCSLRKGTAHILHATNPLTCMSKNIVYVITCTSMTSQSLKARFTQQRRDILKHIREKTTWGTTRLYRHFSKTGHGLEHLTVQTVEEVPEGGNTLRTRESHWIRALKTTEPHGLNTLG